MLILFKTANIELHTWTSTHYSCHFQHCCQVNIVVTRHAYRPRFQFDRFRKLNIVSKSQLTQEPTTNPTFEGHPSHTPSKSQPTQEPTTARKKKRDREIYIEKERDSGKKREYMLKNNTNTSTLPQFMPIVTSSEMQKETKVKHERR
jgi:hypothetical protein